ncbi:hypothetical protein KJ866_04170 [Patescibacteria group bacterium]|nr:hypothetical protein [Patescibacteria group bacterium]MBU2264859.1 hypothetical protein [Patescibacteria group bacterium]
MAGFRNKEKSRSRRTGEKRLSLIQLQPNWAIPSDGGVEWMEEYYSAHPTMVIQPSTAPKKRMCALDPVVAEDNIQIPAPRPVKEETWAEYFNLKFYRLCKWFKRLWAAARFTHPAAWLLAGRQKSRP